MRNFKPLDKKRKKGRWNWEVGSRGERERERETKRNKTADPKLLQKEKKTSKIEKWKLSPFPTHLYLSNPLHSLIMAFQNPLMKANPIFALFEAPDPIPFETS